MIKFILHNEGAGVEELMERVNRYIKVNESDNINDSGIYLPGLVEYMNQLNREVNGRYNIDTCVPINTTSKIKTFIKRALRKSMKWYFDFVMKQQTDFNAYLVRTVNEEQEIIMLLIKKNTDLENVIEKMQLKIQELERKE